MKLKSIGEKFLKGYTVLDEVESKINGQIKVDEDLFGKRRLLVGGLTQSGQAVESIWQKAMRDNRYWELGISNCLILGLGAGNAAMIINKYYPKAKITGVEIDPEIIKLGKKYFGLNEIKNLDIVISDAISYTINYLPSAMSYDMVLVDLYLGSCFPKKAEDIKFILAIKKMLAPKGLVVFNRLYFKENIQKADNFQKKLLKIFPKIEAKKIYYNKIFLCRK